MKVIGTGFGRTGTDSMRLALTQLGFGPCHHMREVMASDEQKRVWRALAQGAEPDWDVLFDGFQACVDWPSAYYWPELIARYPDATVLLTHRDPESWWNSFSSTILRVITNPTDTGSLGVALIAEQVFDGRPDDREHAIRIYRDNVERVKAEVPEDRLLIYELGSGWEPLCDHLGVPVPDMPYPRVNSAAEFQARAAERSRDTR